MNAREALTVCRFVQAACPAQKFDEYTPDVWAELLRNVSFADARAAITDLGTRLTFIGPPEIIAEVRKIRSERIKANYSEPEYDGADVIGGIRAIREHRRAVGDGDVDRLKQVSPNAAGQKQLHKMLAEAMQQMPEMPRYIEGEAS